MDEIIRLDGLSYRYPDGRRALVGISLRIGRGESVALIGPNGAGKSTLLLHLNGIIPGDGRVFVNGEPVTEDNVKEVRRKVGVVFQNPDDQLFSATVFDDVAFGPLNLGWPEERVRLAVAEALEKVGLTVFADRAPPHLSFGERRRVAVASVIVMAPEIIVMDEPGGNLAPLGRWRLVELLRSLPVTRIVATHDLELVAALCDRIVLLDAGRIVADGPAEQLLDDRRLLAAHGLVWPG